MNVIVQEWNGFGLGGVVLFDTETTQMRRIITWDNDNDAAYFDPYKRYPQATKEQTQQWRLCHNVIKVGDTIEIVSGRKMKGSLKTVVGESEFRPAGTYNVVSYYYLFEDGTKVQQHHCKLMQCAA